MREHLASVPQDEPRIVAHGRGHMAQLHPPLRLPPQELDVVRFQLRASRDRRRAVVLLDALIDDEAALDEVTGHRRSGVGRRMLDVRPVHVFAREREIGGDRLARIVRVADDEAADDEHAVTVKNVNRLD